MGCWCSKERSNKMARSIKISKDGKLALLEADVERALTDLLAAEGWQVIPTKAEARMPNGAAAHCQYTLDAVAVRGPYRSPNANNVLFLEFKRRNARTSKARLKGQTANAESLRRLGFAVYQAGEKDDDPIRSFMRFYRLNDGLL